MQISEFLEKVYLSGFNKRRIRSGIIVGTVMLLNSIVKQHYRYTIIEKLGITPFLSIICLILLINQYFFRSRKPKLKEVICLIIIIIYPIIIYSLILLKVIQIRIDFYSLKINELLF